FCKSQGLQESLIACKWCEADFVFQFWQSLAIRLICDHLRNLRRKGLAFDFQFWQFLAISAILAISFDPRLSMLIRGKVLLLLFRSRAMTAMTAITAMLSLPVILSRAKRRKELRACRR